MKYTKIEYMEHGKTHYTAVCENETYCEGEHKQRVIDTLESLTLSGAVITSVKQMEETK